MNYRHKRLLKLCDVHAGEGAQAKETLGVPYAQIVDPAKKGPERVLCEGRLDNILAFAPGYGYLVEGVRRGEIHVAIRSGHGDIGQMGCMDSPTDADMKHALKEDPGCLLQVIDRKDCPVCKESGTT